jgi:streptogramin lyase
MSPKKNTCNWFPEYVSEKMGRLDPETGVIKALPLPGEQPTLDPVGLDQAQKVWYCSGAMAVIGSHRSRHWQSCRIPGPRRRQWHARTQQRPARPHVVGFAGPQHRWLSIPGEVAQHHR